MGTVHKLQDLWRLRRYVAIVAVLAVLAGVGMTVQSGSYDVGAASAQVLVDTQRSQVVGASGGVTSSGGLLLGALGTQANLLADLMVEGTIKADIAKRAGVNPNKLTGVSTAVTVPSASTAGPSPVTLPSGPNVYGLSTQILTDVAGATSLPIIEIDAYAPTPNKAERLANAAVAGLQAFVSSEAATEQIPSAERLSIMNLGVSQATSQARGSSPLIGFVVVLLVLLLGCVSILWIQAMVRGWRSASERERLGLGEPFAAEADWAAYDLASSVAPARSPLIVTNGVSHHGSNGASNGLSNGASGMPDHGSHAPAADYPSFSTGEGADPDAASSARQWSARRWSPR